MDFSEPPHWADIRREAEAFVAEHVTPEMIAEELATGDGVSRPLMRALGQRGWIAPAWPKEEGGAGLDPFEAGVVTATIRASGAPTIGNGTTMLPANAVRSLGSETLKRSILPGVAAGETLICLGYTEPEGGSDVFACKTRAERDGDQWRINGQKMFTTFAHRADYCFLLTRTTPGSAGPSGLTMFLVPMNTPGIECQAVRTMGYERTNIVYYNDVWVDDAMVVGQSDKGLAVIRAALEAEQNIAPTSRTDPAVRARRPLGVQHPDGRRAAGDRRSDQSAASGPPGHRRRDHRPARAPRRLPRRNRGQARSPVSSVRPGDLRPLVLSGPRHGRARAACCPGPSRRFRPAACSSTTIGARWRAPSTGGPAKCCAASSPSSGSTCPVAGLSHHDRHRPQEAFHGNRSSTHVSGPPALSGASSIPSTRPSTVRAGSTSTPTPCARSFATACPISVMTASGSAAWWANAGP